VKLAPFEYHEADSVSEAVYLLAELGDSAKILAGGQSLLPLLALRLARPDHLIDINRATELATVSTGGGLRLGAMVRHRVVERSPEVATANPLLASSARWIGHAAIRNRGTIGGSVAHGDPAAEVPAVLVALDGEIEATSPGGTRSIPAAEFFDGFLTTTLADGEMLTAVTLPAWPRGAGWSFQEFSRRSGDFAMAAAACVVTTSEDGTISGARIALAGMSDRPVRAHEVEDALVGEQPTPQTWEAAASESVADLSPPSDLHGTSRYRRHLAATLVRRALAEAHNRAGSGH
jgi:carbon-monoxide dehydrogenase medium subunit